MGAGRKRKLTDRELWRAEKLHSEGISYRTVAELLGVAEKTLHDARRQQRVNSQGGER